MRIPEYPRQIYLVVADYSPHGTAIAEADLDNPSFLYGFILAEHIRSGQVDPLQVFRFDPAAMTIEDASSAIAEDVVVLARRAGQLTEAAADFVTLHLGHRELEGLHIVGQRLAA
jgi:hypothetical protein